MFGERLLRQREVCFEYIVSAYCKSLCVYLLCTHSESKSVTDLIVCDEKLNY